MFTSDIQVFNTNNKSYNPWTVARNIFLYVFPKNFKINSPNTILVLGQSITIFLSKSNRNLVKQMKVIFFMVHPRKCPLTVFEFFLQI